MWLPGAVCPQSPRVAAGPGRPVAGHTLYSSPSTAAHTAPDAHSTPTHIGTGGLAKSKLICKINKLKPLTFIHIRMQRCNFFVKFHILNIQIFR